MEVSLHRQRILRWGSSHSLGVRAFVFSLVACSASIGVGQSVAQPIKCKTIDFAGATVTKPTGVTARGEIVGFYADSGGLQHGFLLSGTRVRTIDVPGATTGTASTTR